MKSTLSKRKLESYKRAERVAREMRYQISKNSIDQKRILDFICSWMEVTGKIKYERPK